MITLFLRKLPALIRDRLPARLAPGVYEADTGRLVSRLKDCAPLAPGSRAYISNLLTFLDGEEDVIHMSYSVQDNGIRLEFGISGDELYRRPYGVISSSDCILAFHALSEVVPAELRYIRSCSYHLSDLPNGGGLNGRVIVAGTECPETFPDNEAERTQMVNSRYRLSIMKD